MKKIVFLFTPRKITPLKDDNYYYISIPNIYSHETHQYEDTPDANGNPTIEGAYGTLTINAVGSALAWSKGYS